MVSDDPSVSSVVSLVSSVAVSSSSPLVTTKATIAMTATASAAIPAIRPVDGPDFRGPPGGTGPVPGYGG